ncbi:MAG: phage head closure protein [Desulfamplus sp.]|nr:phage head closure protein [Desulfamplus sp.]
MIDPRKLDQRIDIQTMTAVSDFMGGMGGTSYTWASAAGAPSWAQYIPMRGIERIEAGKLEAVTDFKLRIRRWAGLTASHRIIHDSDTCEILGIEDNHRDGDMVIHCRVVE